MKKIFLTIFTVPAVLLIGYAVYARLATRGIRVYLAATQTGNFLVSTWEIALLAGILLALPILIWGMRKIYRLLHPKTAAPDADVRGKTQPLIEPARGSESAPTKVAQSEKTRFPFGKKQSAAEVPSQVSASAQSGLIEPAAPAAQTDLIETASDAGTVVLPEVQEETETAQGTVVLESSSDETVPYDEPQTEKVKDFTENEGVLQNAPRFCSNCGANVEGSKFCPNCGEKVGQ